MRLLPFIIIFLCSVIVFKGAFLLEKGFGTKAYYTKVTKLSEEKQFEAKPAEASLAEPSHSPEASESKESTDKKNNKTPFYPTEDFIKECINQPAKYSDIELQILENLSNRRKELDKREEIVIEKEKLLETASEQVEKKLSQIKTLETSVKDLLAQYNEKEGMKIRSLVRIYQSMKPKDAAKIFDELDMEILLEVIDKMKESNAATIIANMNPEKAKDLTIRIAKQKKLEN